MRVSTLWTSIHPLRKSPLRPRSPGSVLIYEFYLGTLGRSTNLGWFLLGVVGSKGLSNHFCDIFGNLALAREMFLGLGPFCCITVDSISRAFQKKALWPLGRGFFQFRWKVPLPQILQDVFESKPCYWDLRHLLGTMGVSVSDDTHTVDWQEPAPLRDHGKPLLVGICGGVIIPGILRWCRILSIHSIFGVLRERHEIFSLDLYDERK